MRRSLVAALVVVALAVAAALVVVGGPNGLTALLLRPSPEVGRRAPDFTLTGLNGEPVSLESFRGRPVIINFWASWCPPCREEMPHLQAASEADQELVVLAVDATHTERRVEDVTAFVEEYALTFPVVLDRDGAVNEQYLVRALPTSYFVDRQGVIRARYLGGMTPSTLARNLETIR